MSNDQCAEGFRRRLEAALGAYGGSKAALARLSGLPPRTVENYFKGHKPSVPALIALSKALNMDVGWLIGINPNDADWQTGLATDAISEIVDESISEIEGDAERLSGIETIALLKSRRGKIASDITYRIVELAEKYDASPYVRSDGGISGLWGVGALPTPSAAKYLISDDGQRASEAEAAPLSPITSNDAKPG